MICYFTVKLATPSPPYAKSIATKPVHPMPISQIAYSISSIAALIALLYVYIPTAASFDVRWATQHQAYSHGYPLLGLCIVLCLRQFPGIWRLAKAPYWPAILPLLAFSLMWLFGRATHVLVLQQLALPALLLFLLTAVYGPNVGHRLRFPFLLFYAAVPIWDSFNNILQQLTVYVCTLALKIIGIPVLIESTHITIPAGTFEVAGGCSGLNYLLMIGTVAAVYGHLYYRVFWHKILLVACAVGIGLLCNWIRVFSLVIIGRASEMQSPLLADHEMFGWMTFLLCLLPFLYIAVHIEAKDKIRPPVSVPPSIGTPAKASWFMLALFAGLAANLGPIWYASIHLPQAEARLADVFGREQSILIEYALKPDWRAQYRGVDDYLILQFTGKPTGLRVHVASYYSQHQGKELVQWRNALVDGKRWKLKSESVIENTAGEQLNLARLRSNTREAEIVYWYAVGEHFTRSPEKAKWFQFLTFLQERSDASLLAIYYNCPLGECDAARSEALTRVAMVNQLYTDAMHHTLGLDASAPLEAVTAD